MQALSLTWLIDLTGRLHPLIVHFPIGLLIGALILELIAKTRKKKTSYEGIVYLGAFSALLAAIAGQLLYQYGSYESDLVERHQLMGWVTAVLSLFTAFCYWKREHCAKWMPLTSLTITVLVLSITGHWGASITHGEDYLSSVFNKARNPSNLDKWTAYDTLTNDQLDELNLEVRAIFAHNCYQCHSTAKRKSGLALDHEEGVYAGGDNGPVLVRGASIESEMIRRLKLPRSHEDAMPPKGKVIPDESIEVIALWIDEGAHWADTGLKMFREAPMALVMPQLPPIDNKLKHPIDRFVNQYFKEKGIKWSRPIDDHRFIRRAYLDITGLLPTPEAVRQLEKNKDKNKRNQLIKDLLADKENYTLHWMSFWNDLLRNDYSGTGFITGGRKQITHWLYRSLKEGKPYDQMVAELVNPNQESEGFIKGIKWRGVVNASQRTELQAAQNISQSLLGLNLKCASCHNSFVNNLTLNQAYGFANIFAERPLEIFRCDKPTDRMAATSFIYPELGEIVADSLVDRLRQLAEVIAQPKNGRLYRTVVNRYWDKLFGRGIVAPVDEMDKLPWREDLLDWLAADFIENGYDLQHLLETIMTSKVYQLRAVDYGSPNYLASESFVFRGPTPRRLTAEQFADAISQTVHPLYYGMAYLPGDTPYPAEWIWFQDIELDRKSLPKPGKRYFRKTFQIESTKVVESAEILITADHSFELFFNENKMGEGADWRQMSTYSIPPEALEQNNIVAVIGRNDGFLPNPAGLLFALRIIYADGSKHFVYSDRSWSATDQAPSNDWASLNFQEDDWEKVYSQGNKGAWGMLPDFTFESAFQKMPFSRASLVKLDAFMKTLGRPTRENVATTREGNATLLQAMMLANNQFLYENIREGAQQWLEETNRDPKRFTEQIYLKTLGRLPSKKEQRIASKQLDSQVQVEVLTDLIWSVILLPEFQFM